MLPNWPIKRLTDSNTIYISYTRHLYTDIRGSSVGYLDNGLIRLVTFNTFTF